MILFVFLYPLHPSVSVQPFLWAVTKTGYIPYKSYKCLGEKRWTHGPSHCVFWTYCVVSGHSSLFSSIQGVSGDKAWRERSVYATTRRIGRNGRTFIIQHHHRCISILRPYFSTLTTPMNPRPVPLLLVVAAPAVPLLHHRHIQYWSRAGIRARVFCPLCWRARTVVRWLRGLLDSTVWKKEIYNDIMIHWIYECIWFVFMLFLHHITSVLWQSVS